MKLLDDQARCTGQPIGGSWQCPQRSECVRYQVFHAFCEASRSMPIDDAARAHHWPLVSVMIDRPQAECLHKIPAQREC